MLRRAFPKVTCGSSNRSGEFTKVKPSKYFASTTLLLFLTFPITPAAMVKRDAAKAGLDDAQDVKRSRPSSTDHLSRLSDELNLRVLSYLSIAELTTCQRYAKPCDRCPPAGD